ncbi:FAD-dependent monooxygenase sdcF [Cladobotryum mycophilum]|uniref:FAD-dependent monooxygenase sdcF n=1 Tax=Cladobotryum mycophilum TaxID=491253 RepID=A0ABR0SIU1_9HYPO
MAADAAAIAAQQISPSSQQRDTLIAAGLRDLLIFPEHDSYEPSINTWWAISARLRPGCIFQPRSTEDVSRAVRALADLGVGQFSIRSGGHMNWPGSNNVDDGVAFDLTHLNSVTYDPETKLASLGPGRRWRQVYETLEPAGVMVAGGREANVGVGGFLVGGGVSWYSLTQGLGCDTVVNVEIVLADGSIINANAAEHADLWKATRGGSTNFGIITRFDLATFPAKHVWGGARVSDFSNPAAVATTFSNFMESYGSHPNDVLLLDVSYGSSMPGTLPGYSVTQLLTNIDGVEDSPAFNEVLKIPASYSNIGKKPISQYSEELTTPCDGRAVYYTFTIKNDFRVLQKFYDVFKSLITKLLTLLPPANVRGDAVAQPLAKLFGDASARNGGNMTGIDSIDGEADLMLFYLMAQNTDHMPILHREIKAAGEEVEEFARSLNFLLPFKYLNYAEGTQDVLAGYGQKNVDFMREVALKYDPTGVFQRMVPGGWKISKVE